MKDFPITNGFSQNIDDMVGYMKLNKKAIDLIQSDPMGVEFDISFIGSFPEDGVYKNVELIGVSIMPKRKNT